LAREILLFL